MKRIVRVPQADYETLQRIVCSLGDDKRAAARTAVGYDIGEQPELEIFGTAVAPGKSVAAEWSADEKDRARVVAGMTSAKASGRLVAVAIHGHHWDSDWQQYPDWLLHLCRGLIDDGADLILGTGAPVMQPIAFHRGKAIIPGLGNFVFHTDRSATYDEKGVDVWRSAVIRLTLDDDGNCERLEVLPIAVARPATHGARHYGPVPLGHLDSQDIFSRACANVSVQDRYRIHRMEDHNRQ
jgi:poly-gamma-glutamate synthesis protein (capsule biosynthesis protein)